MGCLNQSVQGPGGVLGGIRRNLRILRWRVEHQFAGGLHHTGKPAPQIGFRRVLFLVRNGPDTRISRRFPEQL